jgi:DDE superfamily endonuclease
MLREFIKNVDWLKLFGDSLMKHFANTCCPSLFQKLIYSGHKCCHGIMFQSVVTPDGLFASMYGLVSGNRHDSFLLSKSGLLNKLQEFVPDDAPEDIAAVIYSLYGDPAYPQSIHIFGG